MVKASVACLWCRNRTPTSLPVLIARFLQYTYICTRMYEFACCSPTGIRIRFPVGCIVVRFFYCYWSVVISISLSGRVIYVSAAGISTRAKTETNADQSPICYCCHCTAPTTMTMINIDIVPIMR